MAPSVVISFVAGLASFFSPCVLSLVPAYVGYLSGRAIGRGGNEGESRWITFSHGVAFVLGFSIVFILLGITIGILGGLLTPVRKAITIIGGIIVIFFGLHMTGLLRIPFLEYELRPQTKIDERRTYFSSALMGVFFSAGWTPCTGPTLGAIMTMVFNGGSLSLGAGLLSAYSLGLAIPFLFAALGISWVTRILRKHDKALHYVEVGMGVVLIIVGALLSLGVLERLNILFSNFALFNI